MKVRTRLMLYGAVLPTLGSLGAVLVAGAIFAHNQMRAVDEALLGQAAVEAVSLFDGPGGEPHLHLADSPLVEAGSYQPTGVIAIYGPDGKLMLRFPDGAAVPPKVLPDQPGTAREPRTVVEDGRRQRELVVDLVSSTGTHYVLRLATPLGRLEATIASFYRATLGVCGALALVLFLVQRWQARRLGARITTLGSYLPRLREGDFDTRLDPDATGDELADLGAALAEAAEQLKAARDRQARLIANAAHELRTPLGLMRTEMDLALRKQRSAEELRAALVEARGEVDRLAALAQQLLDLAARRRVSLEQRRGDLVALGRAALEACRSEADRRALTLALAGPERALAQFAPASVRQAVDNLLSNALKFAPRGTTVTLALEPAGRGWRILVCDEGPGVAEADRERIFEPFFRGRDRAADAADAADEGAHAGAGLGLAIVREIAHEHGGEAALLPRADGITRFAIELP